MHARRAIRDLAATTTLSCLLLAGHAETAHAQWAQTNGPKGGSIWSLVAFPNGAGATSLFAGQYFVWRTDDRGANWTHLTNGLSNHNVFALAAVPNGSGGNDLLAGNSAGVFRSTNLGASWSSISNGIPANTSIYALTSGPNGAGGTNLYAGGFLGATFRSTDNGASWTAASSGLPVGQANINALTTTSIGTVIAGTMDGIYRSTNFGASWTEVFSLFAFAFAKHGTTLYAGTSNGVYRSTNDGATWTPINTGLNFTWVRAMAAIPNGPGVTLFAGAGGVLRSTDNGASWTSVNNGMGFLSINALTTMPNGAGGTDLIAGTGEGVYRSSNNGDQWTNASFNYSNVRGLTATPSGAILAGTENDIFRSTDAGANWTDTQSTTTALDFAVNPHGTSGVSIFAGSSPGGIYKSTNDGATWVYSANLLDDFDVNSMGAVPNGSGGTTLFAGSASELFISTDDGAGWRKANLQTLVLDYVATPNGSGGHDIFAGGYGGVWRSTNYGTAWTPVNAGLTDKVVTALASTADGTNLFAGVYGFGVYRSTNQGTTWAQVNNGLTNLVIVALLSPDGTNLFAAGAGGVFLSTDDGESWTSVGTGLSTGVNSLALSADGSTLLAAVGVSGVWKRPLSEMIDVEPPPPPSPPAIASFSPASGPVGTEVTILGSNFIGTSAVSFNGNAAAGFTVVSPGQIRANVPSGATTGQITVTTPAGTANSATSFTVTTPPTQNTLTFTPPHDAYVRSTSPSSNFGSAGQLRVRSGSQTIRSYLKFNLSGIAGTIQSATLRLRVTDAGPSGGSVFAVSNNFSGTSNPWTESGLTWNNAPALAGGALDAAGAVSNGAWVELDVTSAITGNGTFSFAVSGGSSNVVDYSSSEGANPPQLVVVMLSGGGAMRRAEVSSLTDAMPREMTLDANRPNPFTASTTIHYSLPRATAVKLVIYDVTGRAVRSLVDGFEGAGDRQAIWDGRDEGGSPVGPGLYVYRLEAGGTILTRKMSRLK